MSTPFPGMDPYLEGKLWGVFHHDLATAVRHLLIPKLRPRYYPFTERYFLVDAEEIAIAEMRINPDVAVVRESPKAKLADGAAGVATAPLRMRLPAPRPRRVAHYRIAIRDVEKRKLITAIEFLSPTNKRGEGRRQYLGKRDLLLGSRVHLVEIDLLRLGRRLPMQEPLPSVEYFVFVSRAHQRPTTDVWPISIREPLPVIPIPLRRKDPEVLLDLEQALAKVYDEGDFDSIIDYGNPPEPPLTRRQDAWADRWLREKGLRK
jgi:hypothetical protein